LKQFIFNILQGIVIGIANIIPGVSGSTLAVILGIYEKILNIVTKFDIKLIKLICQFKWLQVEKHISFKFLLSITIGIIISFIFMSNLIRYLFENYETYTWAYFFGIIFISIWYVSKYINKWSKIEYLFLLIGFCISMAIFFINPDVEENKNLIFVFICGVVGVLGMLVPGLSGSYLILLMGNYQLIFSEALQIIDPNYYFKSASPEEFKLYLNIFLVFFAGHIFGIVLFSRFIKWLLQQYRATTFATLTGFIAGSLIWIWPWKNHVQEFTNSRLDLISLPSFTQISDLYIICMIFLGTGTIIIIEHLGRKY
jgi:putative membrane protein